MKKVVVYFGTWANYRPGRGKFEPTDIDPQLCTHLCYAFFGISDTGAIKILDSWLDVDLKCIEKTIQLKQINGNLKVLAAVGGWNEGSTKYSVMAADAKKRATFISSSVALLLQYGFDGLDLDWEYPAQRGGSPADRQNFVRLLQELNAALKTHNKLLTVAVAAGEASASQSYDIRAMSKHVDLINLMTYDFHGSWENVLGHNSPLPESIAAVNYWLSKGAPPSKLLMGIPSHGRTFTLSDRHQTTINSPSCGAGQAGPYTREPGWLGYNEICESIGEWHCVWDAVASVPYAFKDNQWVSYVNERTIEKVMDFVNSRGLAGVMVWSIETDDFDGFEYPLLRSIKRHLQ